MIKIDQPMTKFIAILALLTPFASFAQENLALPNEDSLKRAALFLDPVEVKAIRAAENARSCAKPDAARNKASGFCRKVSILASKASSVKPSWVMTQAPPASDTVSALIFCLKKNKNHIGAWERLCFLPPF